VEVAVFNVCGYKYPDFVTFKLVPKAGKCVNGLGDYPEK
jgi:hypothetical protein